VASKSLMKWLKMLWENQGMRVWCVVSCLLPGCLLSPAAGEFAFLLMVKERANYMHAALFSYMGKYGAPRRRVGGRLDGPCRDPAIMAYLVPEQ
jgi:hypothetical protein